ncbi:TauD/TfdA family dioxygenase [Spirosoma montaniterrae]|uniref:TauD/TfdA-like domain-containing protein n=1 Tax=Spirosoma montaniterrae TaxID=1178516 RepID=A0A1P9WXY8_9BACT|nr:TauD/TfdA family dioxygenase [Spirosoma montaniterrae]AQG80223.1 hypothetical protein AWR27_13385 [Spirosoma montaniterrae]
MSTFFREHIIDIARVSSQTVVDTLNVHGVITFEHIYETSHFLKLCNKIGTVYSHPDADYKGITSIEYKPTPIAKPGLLGFTKKNLIPHTDRATVINPPFYTSLLCIKPAIDGGDTILVDGKKIYNEMKMNFTEELSILEKPDIAIFGRGKDQLVSAIFAEVDLLHSNKFLRFRYDDVSYFSAEAIESINIFLSLVYKYKHEFRLEYGQGYIVQNGRWLHGRSAFDGERLMYRVLINSSSANSDFGFSF